MKRHFSKKILPNPASFLILQVGMVIHRNLTPSEETEGRAGSHWGFCLLSQVLDVEDQVPLWLDFVTSYLITCVSL